MAEPVDIGLIGYRITGRTVTDSCVLDLTEQEVHLESSCI
jgi:hypothetical protein